MFFENRKFCFCTLIMDMILSFLLIRHVNTGQCVCVCVCVCVHLLTWSFTQTPINRVDAGCCLQSIKSGLSQVPTKTSITGLARQPLQRGIGEGGHVFPAPVGDIDLPQTHPRSDDCFWLQHTVQFIFSSVKCVKSFTKTSASQHTGDKVIKKQHVKEQRLWKCAANSLAMICCTSLWGQTGLSSAWWGMPAPPGDCGMPV